MTAQRLDLRAQVSGIAGRCALLANSSSRKVRLGIEHHGDAARLRSFMNFSSMFSTPSTARSAGPQVDSGGRA
jgi:hypothetical protein